MYKLLMPYMIEPVFLRKSRQPYGYIPGSISCSVHLLNVPEEIQNTVKLYASSAINFTNYYQGNTAQNTGRAFAEAIGTMIYPICACQTAIMQPIQIPIETVITGFGVLGFLRSPACVGGIGKRKFKPEII
jgi:hypothetical protein